MRFLGTEQLARRSAERPWTVIAVWVALLLLAGILIASLLGSALTTEADITTNPESKQAQTLIEHRLRGPQRDNEIVIVQSQSTTVDDPAFRRVVEDLYTKVTALGPNVIAEGHDFYQTGDQSLVSKDRHVTILPFAMAGTFQNAGDHIDKVSNVVHATKADGIEVLIAGNASMGKDFQSTAQSDLETGEAFGIPIALLILALVFGALAASFIPIVLALLAIVLAVAVSAIIGQQWQLSFFVTNVITMIGLAVGIDYSLFVVSRYREERGHGLDKLSAIARTGATASRTVFFSGVTVIIALLGMLIVPQTIFRSIAAGSVLVVVMAVLASLTLLPAILSLLGDRLNAGHIPLIQQGQAGFREERPGGFWDRLAKLVMNHAVLSVVLAGGLLIAASIPYFRINTGFAGISTLPDRLPAKRAFTVLDRNFSGGLIAPAQVVIDGDANSAGVRAGVERLKTSLASDASFGEPRYEANNAGDLALLEVPVAGDPNSDQAQSAVKRLRHQYVPEAFNGVPERVLVGGAIAANLDGFDVLSMYTPIVFVFVLGLSFILLMFVFRSIVVPVKAVIMNLLSVGAAYGLLVLVTQEGVGARVLGFQQVESIEAWLPIFLFAILFGLSMDYHVFLLSRIKEHYDETGDNTESVRFGVRSTGRLITGAALIMVAVFAGFAAGDLVMFQEMGFGAGVAVLIDATIVRSILVPASMKLLGDWNWYLPSWLQWLPRLQVEGPQPAASDRNRRQQPDWAAGGGD
ncbi:MAG: MMPL family transporter [Chloroflexota bacterium]|nr:MMPL family transporter [Chloroflexota bacterium]